MRCLARNERGSAAIEAAVGIPAFVLFLGLILYGGRVATTHQGLEAVAADAARVASLDRSGPQAQHDARLAATADAANQHIPCQRLTVTVDTAGFTTPVGRPATVEVTVRCQLDLADLTVPGIPGSRVLSASVSSPLDTWRQRS